VLVEKATLIFMIGYDKSRFRYQIKIIIISLISVPSLSHFASWREILTDATGAFTGKYPVNCLSALVFRHAAHLLWLKFIT
jgi:hypothetical protein